MADDPIRVLHFADIHIGMENFGRIDPVSGVNQRVRDFVLRLKDIVDYAIEHDADVVVFAGDAFKTRDPNPTYLREFARQIMRLSAAKIYTVLLVGNHDMPPMDKRANSVDVFRTLEVPFVIVGSTEKLHTLQTKRGALQIATVPWPQRSRLLQFDDELRGLSVEELDRELERLVESEFQRLADEVDVSLPAVLTGHFTVNGAVYGSERNVMIGRDAIVSKAALSSSAWDYVALGHIHKHQDVNAGNNPPMVYSGSLERIDFGEERDAKGFCWIELARGKTRWQFVSLPVRRFLTIDIDVCGESEPMENILAAIEQRECADAVVRLRIKHDQEQQPKITRKDIERALADAQYVAGISFDVARESRTRIGITNTEAKTPLELLEAYLVSKNVDYAHAQQLLTTAREIIQN